MPVFRETNIVRDVLAAAKSIPGIHQSPSSVAPVLSAVTSPPTPLEGLLSILSSTWMSALVGYYLNHRPASPYGALDDEYKVQDLIYTVALAFLPDLHFEDPQDKTTGAVTSSRVDFTSDNAGLFLETKLATVSHAAKKVEAEISEDIVKYGKQGTFAHLVFFVYCYQYTIPNQSEFEKGFTGPQVISGHAFGTRCIVKP